MIHNHHITADLCLNVRINGTFLDEAIVPASALGGVIVATQELNVAERRAGTEPMTEQT